MVEPHPSVMTVGLGLCRRIVPGKEKLGGAIVFKNNTYSIAKKVSDLPPNDYPAQNRVWDFFQMLLRCSIETISSCITFGSLVASSTKILSGKDFAICKKPFLTFSCCSIGIVS